MDWQKIVEQSIALLFPLIVIFLFVYYMLKSFFDQFEQQRKQELKVKFTDKTLPLKLQAYERLTIFLERIRPESLVLRNSRQGLNVFELQKAMVDSIREEFEHNLSQQIYVSDKAWAMVSAARLSMVKLIGETASQYKPDEAHVDYATDILEEYASVSDDPVTLAINYLRVEAKEFL
jgi:hypothetical protein